RFVYLGLILVLSQLSTGCLCCHRCWWRFHCAPCPPCAPMCGAGGPVLGCSSPVVPGPPFPTGPPPNRHPLPMLGTPQPGVPIITSPMPIYPGATVTPSQELPTPRPVNPSNCPGLTPITHRGLIPAVSRSSLSPPPNCPASTAV